MKDILYKIAFGFLFGIGLSAAVIAAFFITEKLTNNTAQDYREYSDKEGLKVTGHHSRKTKDGVIVLGALENDGVGTWTYIKLEAEIYDENGTFIDECNETIDTKLFPGQKENFKITCGGCSNNKIATYGNIVVKIKGANYVYDKSS